MKLGLCGLLFYNIFQTYIFVAFTSEEWKCIIHMEATDLLLFSWDVCFCIVMRNSPNTEWEVIYMECCSHSEVSSTPYSWSVSFLLINFLPYTWAFTLNTKSQKIDIFKNLVDSSALSSSGDIEHSSCCLSGDKCQRIKASIRKKYYLITKYVQWPFNRNFLWLSQYIEND